MSASLVGSALPIAIFLHGSLLSIPLARRARSGLHTSVRGTGRTGESLETLALRKSLGYTLLRRRLGLTLLRRRLRLLNDGRGFNGLGGRIRIRGLISILYILSMGSGSFTSGFIGGFTGSFRALLCILILLFLLVGLRLASVRSFLSLGLGAGLFSLFGFRGVIA